MTNKDRGNGLEIRSLTRDEFADLQRRHFEHIFANRANDMAVTPHPGTGSTKTREIRKSDDDYTLYLGLYLHNEFIGWHTGAAVDNETYYMRNSAILEQHRGKGLYARFLDGIRERLREDGFQVVTGLHHPNNAAVIIPKLRAGFVISGMQFHERFRFLIERRYYFDEGRRKSYGQRMGLDL